MQLKRTVRGFHGTTRASAEKLANGDVPELSNKPGNWLGRGFYFFEENYEDAYLRALDRANVLTRMFGSPSATAVISADVDLTGNIDLCSPAWQLVLVNIAAKLKSIPKQDGPELETHAGRLLKICDYEEPRRPESDPLDHFADNFVIDALVADLRKNGQDVASVRGAFTIGKQPYENSHFFSGTHVQIAVIDPHKVISDIRIV